MNARSIAGGLFGLALTACGSTPGAEPLAPPDAVSPPDALQSPGPEQPPATSLAVSSGWLALTGRLDGQLHGIDLAGETTDNAGTFEVWEHGGGRTQLNIAARGTPSGAGMLIVTFMGSALDDVLETGTWAGSIVDDTVVDSDGEGASTVVTSCAGPSLGNWPFELPATSAEITATEEPERPGSVVLLVQGEFPAAHLGADATTELVGTFRFDRAE
jgi:hypothetical protein